MRVCVCVCVCVQRGSSVVEHLERILGAKFHSHRREVCTSHRMGGILLSTSDKVPPVFHSVLQILYVTVLPKQRVSQLGRQWSCYPTSLAHLWAAARRGFKTKLNTGPSFLEGQRRKKLSASAGSDNNKSLRTIFNSSGNCGARRTGTLSMHSEGQLGLASSADSMAYRLLSTRPPAPLPSPESTEISIVSQNNGPLPNWFQPPRHQLSCCLWAFGCKRRKISVAGKV